jgi:protein SCO1/2
MNRRRFFANFASDATRPMASLGASYYTNARLRTHENKEVRFYDDLIKGKHVVINFMYASCQGLCPAMTTNLVKVQEALKDRVGRDIFMYSITLKPEQDGPEALKSYAEMHGAKPGWVFLTGDPHDISIIRFRMFNWGNPGLDLDATKHAGMIRVINDSRNCWTGCSALASVHTIKQVIQFADPLKPLKVRLEENRIAQEKIDRMTVLPTWLNALGSEK